MSRNLLLLAIGSVVTLSLASMAMGCGGGGGRHRRASALPEGPMVASAPNPALDGLADDQARAASARRSGVRSGEILHGETQQHGASQQFRVQLDAEHCYWFGGATDEMGEQIAIRVFDPSGKDVAVQKSKGQEALLEYCPSADGIYKVETKLGHHGQFALAVYGGARLAPAVAPAGVADPTPEELIAKEAPSAAPGGKRVGALFEGSAGETSWSAALTAGKCYWFIGAGQPGKVKKLSLYVWNPKNSRVTENKAESNVVSIGHCAKETGMFKFQAKVQSGSGLYKVGLFEKE